MDSHSISSIEEGLLREGAVSYRLAKAAIREYEALVLRRSREVVVSEQGRIAEVIGSPPKDLKDFQQFGAASQYAALGLRASGNGGSSHFFAFWWDREKLYASVWTEFKDSEKKQRAWGSLLDAHRTELAGSNATEIWVRLDISGEEAGNPWSRMSKCIQDWSEAWGKVPGGLKQFL